MTVRFKLTLILLFTSYLCQLSKAKSLVVDDPKLDYVFHDELSSDSDPIGSDSVNTTKKYDIEIEEDVIDSIGSSLSSQPQNDGKNKSTVHLMASEDSTTTSTDQTNCGLETKDFNRKITSLLDKFVPEQLKLRPIEKGVMARILMENGKLNINKDYKLMGEPVCTKIDDELYKYDLMLSFDKLMGSYDWNIYNLFRYNFSESALITIKEMVVEMTVTESSKQKTKLEDLKIGKIDGLEVKVNIPERIASSAYIKPMLEYVVSRITTIVANSSMDSIVKNMKDIVQEAIEERLKIKP